LTEYKKNTATEVEILEHFKKSDQQFIPNLSSKVNLEVYAQKLSKLADNFEVWVDDDLVGVVSAYMNDPIQVRVFISNVSVLEKFTGKGFASKLLDDCLQYAKSNGFKEVVLEVNSNNQPACSLYYKKGFRVKENHNDILKLILEI
jgi:ribosomal protein S18 acetylase RimI-like enzyme